MSEKAQPEKTQSEKIDLLFKSLGVWGRYQVLQMALVKGLSFPACIQLYIYMYLGYQPPIRCQSVVNLTSEVQMYLPTNTTVDTSYHNKCAGLVDYGNGSVTRDRCDSGYDYNQNKHSTLISEWDLVCDRSYQAQLTQTVFVIGQGIGATLFTSLGDRFGRRKVCLASQWIMLAVSLATAFSPSILVFTLIRVVMGAVQQGLVMSFIVMPLELLPKSGRALIHLLGGTLWSAVLFILCGVAYGFRDSNWRYFQLTTVAASVFTLLPNMLFLEESLRWLLANGRTEEAKRIIDKAAKMNGIDRDDINKVAEDCLSESVAMKSCHEGLGKQAQSQKRTKSSILDICRHSKLRQTAVIMFFAWIVNAGTSFGLSLTAAKLSGDRFLNYFLISMATLPGTVVSYIVMQRFGRKMISIVSHFLAGSTLLSAGLINYYLGPSGWVNGLTFIGKFGSDMSWGTLFIYTSELYPTNVRSVGLGLASSASRIGGMLAPFATIVIDYHPWLPGAVYGGGCLGVGLLLFLLPETVNKELPQTIEERNAWRKKKYHGKQNQ